MSTHYSNKEIKKYFTDLFSEKTYEEKISHEAYMLHYRVMQLVEKAMDERGWNKKQLAQEIGKSQSYVTQLFLGHKIVNLPMLALLQDKLGLEFKLEIKSSDKNPDENTYEKKTPSGRKSYKLEENKDFSESAEPDASYRKSGNNDKKS
ncbi:MAG: helix-turn-helix domain-containing protein [Bacteroidales bacterium]|nr:helix-turn-helix domain-containing protein [Bacteroidales bacterium]MCF8339158.1 helix-turn-helix domain-containing protein [Bacteroidales bacterium]